jgi:hypothetical protein
MERIHCMRRVLGEFPFAEQRLHCPHGSQTSVKRRSRDMLLACTNLTAYGHNLLEELNLPCEVVPLGQDELRRRNEENSTFQTDTGRRLQPSG